MVTTDIWKAIQLARLADKGIWPAAGGLGDQTTLCRDAFDFIWSEQARCRAAIEKRATDGR